MGQTQWEKMIKILLQDKNPCETCIVKVMCKKSFVGMKGGGCQKLREALENALDFITGDINENKK